MPQHWDYARLRHLAEETRPEETTTLEFKSCDELRWGEGTFDPANEGKPKSSKRVIEELSRDISAMANSAGGTIIYGVKETGSGRAKGLDPKPFQSSEKKARSVEWLDQTISTSINPPPEVHITPVYLDDDLDKDWYYVVEVQQGVTIHMAKDKSLWKRMNRTRREMEQYEIVDTINRARGPILDVRLQNPSKPTYRHDRNARNDQIKIETLTLKLELTSHNFIAAEHGEVQIYMPRIIGKYHYPQSKEVGVKIGNSDKPASFIKLVYRWSLQEGFVVYPSNWSEYGSIAIEVPPAIEISGAVYLIKIELYGPNTAPRSKWFRVSPESNDYNANWFVIEVEEQDVHSDLADHFWRTHDKAYRYYS